MWNSPNAEEENGRQYRIEEIRVLTYPLPVMLDEIRTLPIEHAVSERILQRMTGEEVDYALYELFQALLEPTPVPQGGHPGYQQALIAELLSRAYGHVEAEIDDPERYDAARRAAWSSAQLIRAKSTEFGLAFGDLMQHAGVDPDAPEAHLSPKLTRETWRDLLDEGAFWYEFLQDGDWRYDGYLDLPESEFGPIAKLMGLNLDVTQALPHTPSPSEHQAARDYLNFVSDHEESL